LCTFSPDFREGGSEQIREGAQISKKPPTGIVERFFFYVKVRFYGKSEGFDCSIDPEASEIGIERFESAYYLFFINSGGDGKLLGKNAVWEMIVFSRLNKVNFFLYIVGSLPVGISCIDNLTIFHQVVFV
jgi:hypothetical protein